MATILSTRMALASAGLVLTAVILRLMGPALLDFLSEEIPRIYSSLLSWLTPPYLYFVINGIIISIAASSRFQKATQDRIDQTATAARPEFTPLSEYEVKAVDAAEPSEMGAQRELDGPRELVVYGEEVRKRAEEVEVEAEEEEFVISRSSWSPKRRESGEVPSEASVVAEKPPVSSRFGHHRKSARPSPEGKALRVARSKRNETLECTWKTITDGRPVPLARHLKKADTWDVHGRGREGDHPTAATMKKAETFSDRRQDSPQGASPAGRLRREPSLGQDDLNRRVEAFINKFNQEMRLQRQESFKHYLEMINRGSH